MKSNMKYICWKFVFIIPLAIVLFTFAVQLLWNWLVPAIFGFLLSIFGRRWD